MTWFSNILETMTFAKNSKGNNNNKVVHFRIINKTEKPVCIKIFSEDPTEICEDDDDDYYDDNMDESSGAFNGYDATKVIDLMPNQQFIHKRECMCMDCHVGTILVDSQDNLYYFDAQKGSSSTQQKNFSSCPDGGRDSMDSTTLVTAIKGSSPAARRSLSVGSSALQEEEVEEVELVNVQIEDEEEVVTNGEEEVGEQSSTTSLPKRIVTMTIENRPREEFPARERWLSQGTLEASIAQFEQSFTFMRMEQPTGTRCGPFASSSSSASFRLEKPRNQQLKSIHEA